MYFVAFQNEFGGWELETTPFSEYTDAFDHMRVCTNLDPGVKWCILAQVNGKVEQCT
jgi:hypothetical protein